MDQQLNDYYMEMDNEYIHIEELHQYMDQLRGQQEDYQRHLDEVHAENERKHLEKVAE